MKKEDFLKDVMHEIKMLKKHATPKEIANLNFDEFNANNLENCIYGQMTGSCMTPRAGVLMNKGCKRVWDTSIPVPDDTPTLLDQPFRIAKKYLNGSYNKKIRDDMWNEGGRRKSLRLLSALEGYIALKGAKNKEIIEYLKGERDTLTL